MLRGFKRRKLAQRFTATRDAPTRSGVGPVLCIVQQPTAHLGRLRSLLRDGGVTVVERLADRTDLGLIDVAELAGLISLGGDMGAHETATYSFMAPEIDLLERAHGHGVPILGICLGAQLLATALGGRVTPGGCREIGWLDVEVVADDPLLGPPRHTRRFQWHSDAFDLPPGAELLARSPAWPVSAYRSGRSYGLQFHPEIDAGLIEAWASGEGGSEELEGAGTSAEELLSGAVRFDHVLEAQARQIAGGFAALVRAAAR
jgi:GMP synthase (glutamine-hydrolysing)